MHRQGWNCFGPAARSFVPAGTVYLCPRIACPCLSSPFLIQNFSTMKTAFKNGRPVPAITIFFLLALIVQVTSGFTTPVSNQCSCTSPVVTKDSQTTATVSFSWEAVDGANGYNVWYVRSEDSFTSQPVSTGGTSVNFTNLPAGTYDFYFITICVGESSGFVIYDDLIMG